MSVSDFHTWQQRRDLQRRQHVPAADLVVPLVAQAGHGGMTRADVGKSVGDALDHDALDALLAGLVEFGILTATNEDGLLVFRAVKNSPIRLPGSLR